MHFLPFQPDKMGVKSFVGFGDELFVKPFLASPDLSPATSRMALRFGSNAKATRHTPSAAANRNSFMLAWREPSSHLGHELLEKARERKNLRPHVLVQLEKLRLELIADINNPTHY
jgi:hypothetical protein